MKLYSDFGPRRARQILVDVIAVAFIVGWIALGATVHGLVSALSDYGEQLERAGVGFRDTMTEAGDTLGGVPLLGSGIRVPLDGASGAGGVLADAGRSQQDLVNHLAIGLGIGVAVLPILMILVVWLLPRLRFSRRAGHARALVRAGAGVDLLALRALTNQKLITLAKIDADATGAWRRGDEAVIRKLAALELEASGVRLRG